MMLNVHRNHKAYYGRGEGRGGGGRGGVVEVGKVVVNRFYIALFSSLEQSHCARM